MYYIAIQSSFPEMLLFVGRW